MNFAELKEMIEDLSEMMDEVGVDEEGVTVRIASQPNWPLEHKVQTLTMDIENGKLYIAEGPNTGYAPQEAWTDDLIIEP